MSRKYQKRHHYFLNWLKVNRSKFPYTPSVTRADEGRVEFVLSGIISAVRFHYTINYGIEIFIYWEGDELERVWIFYEPQDCLDKKLRQNRLKEECFEPFMQWCKETLAKSCYLEILLSELPNTARLIGAPNPECHWEPLFAKWNRNFIEGCDLGIGEYRDFFVPLRKIPKAV
jgi:hypothetical protein